MKTIAQTEFAESSEVDRPLRRAMPNNIWLGRLTLPSSKGLLDPPALFSSKTAHWIWVIPILTLCAHTSRAVTLQTVLQTTLEKNPAIQEAKSGLEQAAGQRLVLRSIVWPNVELGVPAGIQGGHRAGESGIKGFALRAE